MPRRHAQRSRSRDRGQDRPRQASRRHSKRSRSQERCRHRRNRSRTQSPRRHSHHQSNPKHRASTKNPAGPRGPLQGSMRTQQAETLTQGPLQPTTTDSPAAQRPSDGPCQTHASAMTNPAAATCSGTSQPSESGSTKGPGANPAARPVRRRAAPLVPMSKAEYDRQQTQVRSEFDPLSGRTRLIRGDGEVIERIVSRDEQRNLRQQATMGDALSYQLRLLHK